MAPQTPWHLYHRLLSYLTPYWSRFLLSIVSMSLAASTEPIFAWLMKPLMDHSFHSAHTSALTTPQSTSLFHDFLYKPHGVPVAIVAVFIIRGISSYINEYSGAWLSSQLILTLRKELFEKMMRLPVPFFDTHTSGSLVSHVMNDVNQVSEAGFSVITTVVKDGLTVAGLMGMLIYTDWRLTGICAVLLPTVSIGVRIVNKRLRRITHDWQKQMGTLTQTLNETLQSQRLVKLFNAYPHHLAQFEQASHAVRNNQLKQVTLSSTYTGVVQWLISLALALIIYLASQQKSLTAGDFMSFVTAMLMLFQPVKRLTNVHQSLERGLTAAHTLFHFLDMNTEPNAGQLKPSIQGHLRLENLCFTYPTRTEPALKNISLEIKAHQTIGIAGISGSGKSTLLQLLARFYPPSSGTIFLDEQPLEAYELEYLRNNIALVSQDILLLNDTISANIAYGLATQKIDEQAIYEAAKKAQALSFIESLPLGFNTMVGEQGLHLSGGQRQRIAIARALLKQAPILVLDEATSALDAETESSLQEALRNFMQSRTTIIIAHRLSTIQKADRIFVFKQGQLIEEGSHHTLIKSQGEYTRLWTTLQGTSNLVESL